MDAIVKNNRIHVSGVGRYAAHLAALPGYRFDRKYQTHTFPASPVSAVRVRAIHKKIYGDQTFTWLPEFKKLEDQWQKIKDHQRFKTESFPKNLHHWDTATEPWDHQIRAYEFCYGLPSAYLAMDMGTGKTMVAIQEILAYEPSLTLILCPKTVIDVWVTQFDVHAPGEDQIEIIPLQKGTSAAKCDLLDFKLRVYTKMPKMAVVIVNYESAIRGKLKEYLLSQAWDHIILDEAHKIKAPGGKASRFCAKLKTMPGAHKRCLSGTMLPNNRLDAYGQFRFLDPGFFGTSFAKYRAKFAEMGGFQGHEIVGWRNEELFNKTLNFLTFRVDKSVLDLPETLTMWRSVEVSPKGETLLKNLEADFISGIDDGTVTAANALSRLVKMREVTSGFVRDDEGIDRHVHDGRLNTLEAVLDEIPPGDKIVVFCEFRWDLDQVGAAAERRGLKYGEVSGRANDLTGGEFPDWADLVGVHPKSGGLGVELQKSHYCIFYSTGFSLADHEQAKSRLERGGQTDSVRYIHLVAPGTVDEKVYEALRDKKEVVDLIMDYIKRGGKF